MTDDDVKALAEKGVQAALDAGVAENGAHGVAAARVAARYVAQRLTADLAAARAERDEAQEEAKWAKASGEVLRDRVEAAEAHRDATQRKLDEAVGVINGALDSPLAQETNYAHPSMVPDWITPARAFLASQAGAKDV